MYTDRVTNFYMSTCRLFDWWCRDVLVGTVFGLTINVVGDKNAEAAARRPPPPPPTEKEKKDPNVSGALAKVLASKKRKEAMKESIAKLREKGKAINEPSPAPE
ncbi:hypothetical protein HanHA300_Chr02g0072161 [Helianthus annuus]|nr:hypothetical protein HanHA300_Chr02g0072161 [Helianthus annuus]KAJ0778744.1 hypothetical protein HanLR1_Chr02g0074971 [Helianthus annuus]